MALTSNTDSLSIVALPGYRRGVPVRHRAPAPVARVHVWLAYLVELASWLCCADAWQFTRLHVAVITVSLLTIVAGLAVMGAGL